MAKFVVAGRSDCPYFARVELLGDRLSKNLKKFDFHKIMIQPNDWDKWLQDTCKEKGWQFSKSPIIWRELIDRGGKGVLIGGANEFQEYVKAYYDLESGMNSYDMRTISGENKTTKDELDEEEMKCKALSRPLNVAITNAASPVCYHLLSTIGDTLGPKTEMTLHLLVESEEDLELVKGTAMEAEDLAHELLRGVHVHTSPHEAFENCSVVILLDDLKRGADESMKEWLTRTKNHFAKLAVIINDKALSSCKVLVSGKGPINFITGEIIRNAPSLSRYNIVAVASIVENHAKSVIGERLTVNPAGVVDLIVWGNINGNRFLDLRKCRVHNYDGAIWGPYWYSVDAPEMVHDQKWVATEFPELVAKREEKVSSILQHSTCMSEANAISTLLQYWWQGSPSGQCFSMGVYSDGLYGVPEGLVFSFPLVMDPKGYWHIVQDSEITPEVKEGIANAVKDLIMEQQIENGEVIEPGGQQEEAEAQTTEGTEEKAEEGEGKKTPTGEGTEAAADGDAEKQETTETAPASAEGTKEAAATEQDAAGGADAEGGQEEAKEGGGETADESGAGQGEEGEGNAEESGEGTTGEATAESPAAEE